MAKSLSVTERQKMRSNRLWASAALSALAVLAAGCDSTSPSMKFDENRIRAMGDNAIDLISDSISGDDADEKLWALRAVGFVTEGRRKAIWEKCGDEIVESLEDSACQLDAIKALTSIEGAPAQHAEKIVNCVRRHKIRNSTAFEALAASRSDDAIKLLVDAIREFNADYDNRFDKKRSKGGITELNATIAITGLSQIKSSKSKQALKELFHEFPPFPRPYIASVEVLLRQKHEQLVLDHVTGRLNSLMETGRALAVLDQAKSRIRRIETTLPGFWIGEHFTVDWSSEKAKPARPKVDRIRINAMREIDTRYAQQVKESETLSKRKRGIHDRFYAAHTALEKKVARAAIETIELLQALVPIDDKTISPVLFHALATYSPRVNQEAAKLLTKRLSPRDYANRFFAYLTTRSQYSSREIAAYSMGLATHCKEVPACIGKAIRQQIELASGLTTHVSWVKKIIAIDVLSRIGTDSEIPVLHLLTKDHSTIEVTTTTRCKDLFNQRVSRKTVKISDKAVSAIEAIKKRKNNSAK